jgi:hypothetical protein
MSGLSPTRTALGCVKGIIRCGRHTARMLVCQLAVSCCRGAICADALSVPPNGWLGDSACECVQRPQHGAVYVCIMPLQLLVVVRHGAHATHECLSAQTKNTVVGVAHKCS